MNLLLNRLAKRLYRARDLFSIDRATGTINGTACNPGPSTRTVVDTDGKLSIAGGKLLLSPRTTPAWGDPGLWLDVAITRVVGQRAYGTIKVADTTYYSTLGYSTNKSGVTANAIMIGDDNLSAIEAATGPVVYAAVDATEYPICLICAQGGGAHLYIKISTNWLYFGKWGTNTSTSLYFGISDYNATIEADNFIIPVMLKLPAPLSSDGFGGTYPTTDGLGHPEGVTVGAGGAGKTWVGGTWAIVGGALVNTPTLGADMFDAGAGTFASGTYAWSPYSPNTVTNVGNKLVVTFVSGGDSDGATEALNSAADLNANLVVNTWYALQFDANVNAGASVGFRSKTLGATYDTVVTSETPVTINHRWRALHATTNVIHNRDMASGKIATWDNITLKPLTLSSLFTSISESTPDVVASVDLVLTAGTQAGLVLCLDDATTPANFIIVYCDGTNVIVDKCVAGTYTNVLSGAVTYGAGYMLRVDINDGVGRVYYNNLLVGTFTVADAGVKDNVLHGLFSTYSANSIDNYNIYAKGTSGEYAQLGVV